MYDPNRISTLPVLATPELLAGGEEAMQFLQRHYQLAPEYIAERMQILQEVISRTGFDRLERPLKARLYPPPAANEGKEIRGSFSPESKDVAVNGLRLLFADPEDLFTELFHVVKHEQTHAGGNKDQQAVSMDEAMTEAYTLKEMQKQGVDIGLVSGYDSLVKLLDEYTAHLSAEELLALIAADHQQTLLNFIDLIILPEVLANPTAQNLSPESIKIQMQQRWPVIQKLFPRLLNALAYNQDFPESQHSDVPSDDWIDRVMIHLQNKFWTDPQFRQRVSNANCIEI